ncbi:MAG: type II toxin-antitoxin system VapC family toxin [Gemmatimonadota bacterium]
MIARGEMRLCLDTSGYSAFKRGHEGAVDLLQRAGEIVLPAVVIGELLAGFRMGSRDRANRRELDALLESARVRLAGVGAETAQRYAEIVSYLRGRGTPIPTNDVWIAACAMEWGLRLLTTDEHFRRLPQVSLLPLD